MAALEQAIDVLAKATTPGKEKTAFIQNAEELRLKSALKEVVQKIPSKLNMAPSKVSLLAELVSAKSLASYAPQSATIQGMLQDMYTTFALNLQDDTATEADENNKYEDSYTSLEENQ